MYIFFSLSVFRAQHTPSNQHIKLRSIYYHFDFLSTAWWELTGQQTNCTVFRNYLGVLNESHYSIQQIFSYLVDLSAVTPVGNTIRAKTFIQTNTWESCLYSLIRALYIDGTHTVTTYTHQYNFIGGSNLIPRFPSTKWCASLFDVSCHFFLFYSQIGFGNI